MNRLWLILAAFLTLIGGCRAPAPLTQQATPQQTPPVVPPPSGTLTVIVHAESDWPGAARVADAIMAVVSQPDRGPVHLLSEDGDWRRSTVLPESFTPDQVHHSPDGWIGVVLPADVGEVTVVGGYALGCLSMTVWSLWDNNPCRSFRVVLPEQAIYYGEHRTLAEYRAANLADNEAYIEWLRYQFTWPPRMPDVSISLSRPGHVILGITPRR